MTDTGRKKSASCGRLEGARRFTFSSIVSFGEAFLKLSPSLSGSCLLSVIVISILIRQSGFEFLAGRGDPFDLGCVRSLRGWGA